MEKRVIPSIIHVSRRGGGRGKEDGTGGQKADDRVGRQRDRGRVKNPSWGQYLGAVSLSLSLSLSALLGPGRLPVLPTQGIRVHGLLATCKCVILSPVVDATPDLYRTWLGIG